MWYLRSDYIKEMWIFMCIVQGFQHFTWHKISQSVQHVRASLKFFQDIVYIVSKIKNFIKYDSPNLKLVDLLIIDY